MLIQKDIPLKIYINKIKKAKKKGERKKRKEKEKI